MERIENERMKRRKNVFTKREEEVLNLLIEGLNNNEISEKLIITNHTTKAHIAAIYRKLNVSNRVQATVKYLKMKSLIIG